VTGKFNQDVPSASANQKMGAAFVDVPELSNR
jgi:hypothetical protein